VLLLVVPVFPASVSVWLHAHDKGALDLPVQRISIKGVVMFLDARSEEASGRNPLPWAKRLAEETWEEDLPGVLNAWMPEVQLMVFCDDGGQCNRSAQVAERLRRETGIERITVIAGGESAAIRLHEQIEKRSSP
jgi:hypothetical protein